MSCCWNKQAGDLLFVAGDADEAAVEAAAETAQQRLGDGEAEAGAGVGIESGGQRVERLMVVIEVHAGLRAGGEPLLDAGIGERGIGDQRVGAVAAEVGLRRGLVRPVQLADERRVVDGDRRAGGLRDGPGIERLVCGSPSTPSSSALVATEVPAVARPVVPGW